MIRQDALRFLAYIYEYYKKIAGCVLAFLVHYQWIVTKGVIDMKYQLKDLMRDAVEAAKECGIWQLLSMKEKEDVVRYFLCNYDSLMEQATESGAGSDGNKRALPAAA